MIVRGPRPSDNFAQIHNEALADGRLSFKARGILAFLLSRPPGWKTSAERLAKSGIDGERAVKSGLRELEAAGYLKRTRTHGPDGLWIHNQIITDQPQLIAEDTEVDDSGTPVPTTGTKQPDGSTIGTLCTGGKQPDINNTEPNNTYLVAEGVVNPPTVGESPTPPSRTSYGDTREVVGIIGGVELPTRLHHLLTHHGWLSPAALKTAHREITLQELPLSLTKYEIRMKELNRNPSSSEWLRWLIEDEQKILAEERKQAQENGKSKSWFAVAD